ncbi:MAG: carboxylating nicotinate-nucleotide diphosphorylase [Rhodospirillales bacterium]
MPDVGQLYPLMYEDIVLRALQEDLGLAGDVTSDTVIREDAFVRARLVARRPGRVAGLPVALSAFKLLCPQLAIVVDHPDGSDVGIGGTIAVIEGPARPILTGERTALNLLSGLCGIATATRTAVEVVQGTRTRIVCTRKTTPGLRVLEKYAVRVGGGVNHRFGLDDGVLIKDNHIVAAGGIEAAVARARRRLGHMVKIEVEVDTFEQLREVIRVGADAVLLDNMTPAQLKEAVTLVDGRMTTEASGGITLANLGEVAAAGVDIVSLGWLTHSAPILDIGLDLDPLPARAARTAAATAA